MDRQVAAKDEFSKGTRTSSAFSLLFLSKEQLQKYNAEKEREVVNGILQQSKRRLVFAKWTDAYFENQDKLSQGSEANPIVDLRDYFSPDSTDKLQYSFSSCTKEENVSDVDTAKRMFKELVSHHENPEVNLIIFAVGPSGLNIAQKIFSLIDESQDKKVYRLWGGETYGIIECENKEVGDNLYREPIFMGIRMFHRNMKSWSLIVDFREFEEELVKFKRLVQLKRKSLGFISGRSAVVRQEIICNDSMQVGDSRIVKSSDFIDVVKACFPDTPILGGFNLGLSLVYGYNSMKENEGVQSNKLAVSLMIITHD